MEEYFLAWVHEANNRIAVRFLFLLTFFWFWCGLRFRDIFSKTYFQTVSRASPLIHHLADIERVSSRGGRSGKCVFVDVDAVWFAGSKQEQRQRRRRPAQVADEEQLLYQIERHGSVASKVAD